MYHVVTDFKLGDVVDDKNTTNNIWPVCLPKNDNDKEFMEEGKKGRRRDGFIAGWLDTPPVSQLNELQLGFESNTFEGVRCV